MSQLLKSDCRKAQAVSPVMLIYICRKCPAEPVMSHTTMKRFAAELQRHCGCSKWTVARLLSNRECVVVGPGPPFRPRPLANPVLSAVGFCLEALSWPWQTGPVLVDDLHMPSASSKDGIVCGTRLFRLNSCEDVGCGGHWLECSRNDLPVNMTPPEVRYNGSDQVLPSLQAGCQCCLDADSSEVWTISLSMPELLDTI